MKGVFLVTEVRPDTAAHELEAETLAALAPAASVLETSACDLYCELPLAMSANLNVVRCLECPSLMRLAVAEEVASQTAVAVPPKVSAESLAIGLCLGWTWEYPMGSSVPLWDMPRGSLSRLRFPRAAAEFQN